MKSETKNKIIIIESIFLFILFGIFIFGLLNQCGTDTEYQQLSDKYRDLNTESQNLNRELETANIELETVKSEFTEYRDTTETAIIQLSENLDEAGEIISQLENNTISIQTTTEGISEATGGIREILSEVITED